uniref:Vacuolar protein-sorting-associated protein 25 n=1 Tax=Hirondellea gigas TaxID=1518452 RepID=A0A6A7G6V7_9CRUS
MEWPPFYHFPPFFSVQSVKITKDQQISMWINFILDFQKYSKKNLIYIEKDVNSPPFSNPKINRTLSVDFLRLILDELCTRGYGKWQDDEHTVCSTTWKTYDEWANILYKWAVETSHFRGICTIYELHSGDETTDTEFYNLDSSVILIALEILEEQGKAKIVKGETADENGVKFYEV